jgi:hypothetical protein
VPALVTQHFFKQNITGGAFEALAAAAGAQLAIPNFLQGTNADILTAWGSNSANACDFGIRSPSLHDNTRGIRMAYAFQPTVGAGDKTQILLPDLITQPITPSDVLVVEVNGTATNNVGLAYMAYYDQLPGAVQRLISPGELYARFKQYVGVRVSVTAGAAGDFGTARLLNADDDRLIANTDYAVVGLTGQIPACTVVMVAPETSGRPVGCPVHWDANVSGDFFVNLSNLYNRPCIPVINSNNRGNITFQAASPAGATAVAMEVMLVELG